MSRHTTGWNIGMCRVCQAPFGRDESWKTKCHICYKEENQYDITNGDKSFILLQNRVRELETENGALRVEAVSQGLNNISRGLRVMKIPKPIARDMLRFCHPDHNNNSSQSTEVTKWIVEHMKS